MEKTKKKTMVVAIIFAFAFLISALFIPKANNNVYATSNFSGDTLVGTTWLIDEEPGKPSADIDASINFTSNDNDYNSITLYKALYMWGNSDGIIYGSDSVYGVTDGWFRGEAYRTISITGGAAAVSGGTNFAALVAWLNANATLQSGGNGGNGGSGATSTGVAEDIAFASATILMLGALLVVVAKTSKRTKI